MFYVLTIEEPDESGVWNTPIAFYSKERTNSYNNLSCIITYPPWQQKGYARILIDHSNVILTASAALLGSMLKVSPPPTQKKKGYAKSRELNAPGGPEQPLSDLGTSSYLRYLERWLKDVFKEIRGYISVRELADATGIRMDDLIAVLAHMGHLNAWDDGDRHVAHVQVE